MSVDLAQGSGMICLFLELPANLQYWIHGAPHPASFPALLMSALSCNLLSVMTMLPSQTTP